MLRCCPSALTPALAHALAPAEQEAGRRFDALFDGLRWQQHKGGGRGPRREAPAPPAAVRWPCDRRGPRSDAEASAVRAAWRDALRTADPLLW